MDLRLSQKAAALLLVFVLMTGMATSISPFTVYAAGNDTVQKPGQPVSASMEVQAAASSSGHATATITEGIVRDILRKARTQAAAENTTATSVSLMFNISSGQTVKSLTVTVTDKALALLKTNNVKRFAVANPLADLSFDAAAIGELEAQSSGDIAIMVMPEDKLSDAAKDYIGSRLVFEIVIKDDKDKAITNLKGGTVTSGFAYTPKANEKTDSLYAVYVPASGKPELLTESGYKDGRVIFSSNTLSVYGVGYKTPAPVFTDTASHWAKDNIDFAVSRGLLSGTSNTAFSPDTAVNRGMFITALGRLSGQEMSGYSKSSFSDVAAGSYYLPYIEWAADNLIVSGTGGGKFEPDRTITREDMAVMMLNYAAATGYTLPAAREAVTFADNSDISEYARDAVKALQHTGVVYGVGNNRFNPKGRMTRAEASSILRNFVELVIDTATARSWSRNEAGQWMYYDQNGNPVTGWLTAASNKYYFDTNGIMQAGKWMQINSNNYYFNANGKLAVSASSSPASSTTGSVTVTVTAEAGGDVSFIGWRSSSSGAGYTGIDGFTNITKTGKFTVSLNGWYAVGIVDGAGNFSHALMKITNITTSTGGNSGGGSSGGGSSGNGSTTTHYPLAVADITWENRSDSANIVNNNTTAGSLASGSSLTLSENTTENAEFEAPPPQIVSVTAVTLDTNEITLTAGYSQPLMATVSPTNAANKNMTWSSADTSVATVSGGLVSALAPGSADITVTAADGDYTDTCVVIVNALVNAETPSITGHPVSANYNVGESADALDVTASVTDGGTLSYQWYSNTTNSATGGRSVGSNLNSYLPPTSTAGTTYYYVVVTNTITDNNDGGAKTASITSSAEAVTVSAAPLSFGTPTFSGTLKAGQSIDGKLLIPYANAAGTENNNISVAVSGTDEGSISVTAISAALSQGDGTIEIFVTGAPKTAGEVTFTISGIDELGSNNTVTTTVRGLFAGGSGTSADPWQIDSAAGLAAIADNLKAHYKLISDITLNGDNWTPIGDRNKPFTGSLDGDVNTINNLKITSSTNTGEAGLFGNIGSSGAVKNLTLANVYINVATGNANAGGVAGDNRGTITNCSVTAHVAASASDSANAGGVTGNNNGTIKNCYTSGDVTTTGTLSFAGGVAGYSNYGSITNCLATGNVTASASNTGFAAAGGVVGVNDSGSITNCAALNREVYATLNGESTAGRVAGYNGYTLNNNYANSSMKVNGDTVSSSDNDTANGINGKGVALGDVMQEAWWNDNSAGFWRDVWGNTDAAPWQWGGASYPLPTLPGRRPLSQTHFPWT